MVNNTTIAAVAPAHAAGVVTITVTNPDGQYASLLNGFTYVDCPTGCVSDTTSADFQAGSLDANGYVAESGDGELQLAPASGSEFTGSSLPSGWTTSPWSSGGSASLANGSLSVDGALVTADPYRAPGHTLNFVATFVAGAPFQHLGFGTDLNSAPWAIFSTGASGDTLYARSNSGAGNPIDTPLSSSWLNAPHHFQIIWTSSSVTYLIDGTQVAEHALAITGAMRPVISDGPVGGATLQVDWLRLSPYATPASFASRVFDGGGTTTWTSLGWTADQPSGTSLTLQVRTGTTPTPDSSWSAWQPITASGQALNLVGRYLQYQAQLTTSNPDETPVLENIVIGYEAGSTNPDPTVSAVSPAQGTTEGGTTITVTGSNFLVGATVSLGGNPASDVTIVNSTTITATTPAHAAGAVDVVVTNGDGKQGTLNGGFTYQTPAPSVGQVSPATGSTSGGTTATIDGTFLTGTTSVTFDGTPATSFTVNSDTSVTATTPPHATGAVSVTVIRSDGQQGTLADAFTYQVPPPAITQISPATGSTVGGTSVTVTGTDFQSGATLRIGGVAATSVVVVNATTITGTAGAHPSGTVDVVVTNTDGQSATLPGGFTYQPPAPTVSGINPTSGTTDGGDTVTITGTNFTGATSVDFGSAAASAITVNSDTSITATTPPHAAGAVDVTVTTSSGTSTIVSADQFTFVAITVLTDSTLENFNAGTVGNGAYVAQTADGEVQLAPAGGSEFSGSSLPGGWTASSWSSGGSATVASGNLSVDGALVTLNSYGQSARALDFVATFVAGTANQHIGFGTDLSGAPWAIFSTFSGNSLYARTNSGSGTPINTDLGSSWLNAPHHFRIVWTSNTVTYFIDGTQVTQHSRTITQSMRAVISDGAVGGANLEVDWLRLSPYSSSATFTSGVFGAGSSVTWSSIDWTSDLPSGTSVTVSIRYGKSPNPNGSWSSFQTVPESGGSLNVQGRYIQYRLVLTTSDSLVTPSVSQVTVRYLAP